MVPGAPVILEAQAEDGARERLSQIKDYYEARKDAVFDKSWAALQGRCSRRTDSGLAGSRAGWSASLSLQYAGAA